MSSNNESFESPEIHEFSANEVGTIQDLLKDIREIYKWDLSLSRQGQADDDLFAHSKDALKDLENMFEVQSQTFFDGPIEDGTLHIPTPKKFSLEQIRQMHVALEDIETVLSWEQVTFDQVDAAMLRSARESIGELKMMFSKIIG